MLLLIISTMLHCPSFNRMLSIKNQSRCDYMAAADSPLKVAVLVCDVPSEPVPTKFGDYPKMIMKLFKKGDSSLIVDVDSFDCRVGQYPEDASKYHCFVITGSRWSAYDDFSWIRQLEEYLRKLDAQKTKMIGLCFGHQVLAKALGGTVTKNPAGWELGVASFPLSESAQAFFGTAKASLTLHYIHQDHVPVLPPGGKSMGGHQVCAIQGFTKDNHIVAFQGHPEFDSGVLGEFLSIKEENLPPKLVQDARESLELPVDSEWIAQQLLRFVKQT